jgi:hypothetical protein
MPSAVGWPGRASQPPAHRRALVLGQHARQGRGGHGAGDGGDHRVEREPVGRERTDANVVLTRQQRPLAAAQTAHQRVARGRVALGQQHEDAATIRPDGVDLAQRLAQPRDQVGRGAVGPRAARGRGVHVHAGLEPRTHGLQGTMRTSASGWP